MSNTKQVVNITHRDCQIKYNVDFMTVAAMAAEYGIDWADMKSALRSYGLVIRKNEPKPATPEKNYTVNLVDTEKIVAIVEEPVVTAGK